MNTIDNSSVDRRSFYWFMLIGMQVCVFMCTFDSGVVNLALPVIRAQLHLTISQVKWVVISYTATAALSLPFAAWLGRRFGMRRMFLTGVALFSLASGSCGLARNLPVLVALRITAAIGASLILSLNQVIVLRAFPREMHGRALGIAGTTFALGILAGLGAGGVLIHYWSWRSIFLISLPIGLIAWPWNAVAIKKSGMPHEPQPGLAFDWQGMCWMIAGFGSLVWMVNHWLGGTPGPLLTSAVITLVGFLLIAGWLRHEFAGDDTFLHLKLLKIRPLGYNFGNAFSVRILMGITIFIIPFYLQDVLMMTPAHAGLILASGAIAMGIVGPFAGGMSDRRGMQKTIALGLTIMTVGLLGYMFLPSQAADGDRRMLLVLAIISLQTLIGIGSTFFSASNTNSCLHSIAQHYQLSVAGLLSVNLMAGSALGSTMAGEVFSFMGGVEHAAHPQTGASIVVFPPHAFAWLFGTCALWLCLLSISAWRKPETINPLGS